MFRPPRKNIPSDDPVFGGGRVERLFSKASTRFPALRLLPNFVFFRVFFCLTDAERRDSNINCRQTRQLWPRPRHSLQPRHGLCQKSRLHNVTGMVKGRQARESVITAFGKQCPLSTGQFANFADINPQEENKVFVTTVPIFLRRVIVYRPAVLNSHPPIGDLKRPSCSRCLERGHTCTYSSTRRKPGPARGARQGSHRSLLPTRSRRKSFGKKCLLISYVGILLYVPVFCFRKQVQSSELNNHLFPREGRQVRSTSVNNPSSSPFISASTVGTPQEPSSLGGIDTLQDRGTSTERFSQTDFQAKEEEEEQLYVLTVTCYLDIALRQMA